jgi:hypothetical protein
MIVLTVRTVQKIAAKGHGHDFVVGQSGAVKALMKCLKKADSKEVVA